MNQLTTKKADEEVIRELLSEVATAFNKSDLEKLLSFHWEDMILMEPNMPVIHGKKKVREMFAAFKEKKKKWICYLASMSWKLVMTGLLQEDKYLKPWLKMVVKNKKKLANLLRY